MVLRRIIPVVLLSIATLGWLQVSSTVDAQGEERHAWAFYMGFWAGQQSWDWQADVLTDYPAMGAYDSRDPGVAATHIDQAQSAGIDGFVVSWYGVDDQTTTTPVLNNMLDRAAERGFQVGAAFDAFDQSFSIESLTNSLNYLVNDRANHPAYLRYQGKPVIFFVFQGNLGLSVAEWQNVRNRVDPDRNTIWIAEGLNGCCLYGGAMDGMYAFNLAWANGSRSTYSTQQAGTLNAGGSLYIPMVHPGWDETLIAARDGRGNPTSPRARNDGQFLATSFNGAINSGANVIMVGTWNEFMENSHIEPSQQYGTQSLDTLRPLIANWKAGNAGTGTASTATTTSTAVTETPDYPAVQSTVRLNVRVGPSTNNRIIGTLIPGNWHRIIREEEGWIVVDYNGQEGYMSADFVTRNQ
ncbi:MAG: endo-1,3-alpha-glucanase family glycosylhydrolase [Chloroflexota bacterium]